MPTETRTRTSTERAQCPKCEKWVSRRADLTRHMKTHDTNANRYHCFFPHCPFSALQRPGFVAHVIKHTKERPYRCAFCEFDAQDPSIITKHHGARHNYKRGTRAEEVTDISRPEVDWDALRSNSWNTVKIPMLEAWFQSVDDDYESRKRWAASSSTSDPDSPLYVPYDEQSPVDEESAIGDRQPPTEIVDYVEQLEVDRPLSTRPTKRRKLCPNTKPNAYPKTTTAASLPAVSTSITSTTVGSHSPVHRLAQLPTDTSDVALQPFEFHPAILYAASSRASYSPPPFNPACGSVCDRVSDSPETSVYSAAWALPRLEAPSPPLSEAPQEANLSSWLFEGQIVPSLTPDLNPESEKLSGINFELSRGFNNGFSFQPNNNFGGFPTDTSPSSSDSNLDGYPQTSMSSSDCDAELSSQVLNLISGLFPEDGSTSYQSPSAASDGDLLLNFLTALSGAVESPYTDNALPSSSIDGVYTVP